MPKNSKDCLKPLTEVLIATAVKKEKKGEEPALLKQFDQLMDLMVEFYEKTGKIFRGADAEPLHFDGTVESTLKKMEAVVDWRNQHYEAYSFQVKELEMAVLELERSERIDKVKHPAA